MFRDAERISDHSRLCNIRHEPPLSVTQNGRHIRSAMKTSTPLLPSAVAPCKKGAADCALWLVTTLSDSCGGYDDHLQRCSSGPCAGVRGKGKVIPTVAGADPWTVEGATLTGDLMSHRSRSVDVDNLARPQRGA